MRIPKEERKKWQAQYLNKYKKFPKFDEKGGCTNPKCPLNPISMHTKTHAQTHQNNIATTQDLKKKKIKAARVKSLIK